MTRCLFTYFLSPSVFIPCFSVAEFCIFVRQKLTISDLTRLMCLGDAGKMQ
jgi:hypothetical protein